MKNVLGSFGIRGRRSTLGLVVGFGAALFLAGSTSQGEQVQDPKDQVRPLTRRKKSDGTKVKPLVVPSNDKKKPLASATAKKAAGRTKAGKEKAGATGKPKISIEKPTHDFGDVWTVPTISHTFEVRNTGSEILRITKVKPGCGCTVKGAYDRKIAPGGVGKIPLTLRTKGKTNFSTNITITSNDPDTPNMRVTLKGKIRYYVEANPRNVRFNRIKIDEKVKQKVVIKITSDQAKLELLLGGKSGNFQATLTPTDDPKKFNLVVEGTPPFKEGSTNGFIKLKTNVPEQPELQIPISAYVAPRLEIRPKQVYVPKAVTKATPRIIMLNNNGSSPVEVLSASVSNPAVTAVVRELKKGKSYQITLQLPEKYLPPPGGDKLVLKLLDGTEREHVIPILSSPIRKTAKIPAKPRRRPALDLLGKDAPKVSLDMHDGRTFEVGSTGQVTVLEFYTSWCGFCKRSLPSVNEAYQEFKDNPNVRFVAVSEDTRGSTPRDRTAEQVVNTFYKERGLTFDLALDPNKVAGSRYKATSYPTLFVLGKSGKVEAVHVGAKKDLANTLKQEIANLLEGKSLLAVDKPGAKLIESAKAGS